MIKNSIIIILLFASALIGFISLRVYRMSSESSTIIDEERYQRMVAEKSVQDIQQLLKKTEIKLETVQGERDELKILLQKEQALSSSLKEQVSELETANVDLENALKVLTVSAESNVSQ